jgi:hypothetical protein
MTLARVQVYPLIPSDKEIKTGKNQGQIIYPRICADLSNKLSRSTLTMIHALISVNATKVKWVFLEINTYHRNGQFC